MYDTTLTVCFSQAFLLNLVLELFVGDLSTRCVDSVRWNSSIWEGLVWNHRIRSEIACFRKIAARENANEKGILLIDISIKSYSIFGQIFSIDSMA